MGQGPSLSVVEQGDKDVAKENGVQLKSRLDNAAVLHEAEGLVVSKKRLETHPESEGVKFFKEVRSRDYSGKTLLCSHCGRRGKRRTDEGEHVVLRRERDAISTLATTRGGRPSD